MDPTTTLYNTSTSDTDDIIKDLRDKNNKNQAFIIKDAQLQGKGINQLNLNEGSFVGCNFTAAKIMANNFKNCEFNKCNFSNATITGVKFDGCTFFSCDFNESILEDVYFLSDANKTQSVFLSGNKFNKVKVKANVTLDGEDISSFDQFKQILNDANNVIADDVNEEKQQVQDILNSFKCFTKTSEGSFELVENNITLTIDNDEAGWRIMFGYNKDGKFEDEIISDVLINKDEQDDSLLDKKELVSKIKEMVKSLGDGAKSQIETDFIKKSIDTIVNKVNSENVVINEAVENSNVLQIYNSLITKVNSVEGHDQIKSKVIEILNSIKTQIEQLCEEK